METHKELHEVPLLLTLTDGCYPQFPVIILPPISCRLAGFTLVVIDSDFHSRLQNSRLFLKISRKKREVWRDSLTRAKRASECESREKEALSPVSFTVFSLVPDLLFDCSGVLEYAKIRLKISLNGQAFFARSIIS